jgi:hypothetical protein
LSGPKYLLDVNVLIALTEPQHIHHQPVMEWFNTPGLDWGLCAFSEAGFLRVTTNPRLRPHSLDGATRVLSGLVDHPGYRFWPITCGWPSLIGHFQDRIYGHQQITDAYLLGLAIKEDGVLVTLDGAIRHMAGSKYGKHLLVLTESTVHR